jgi:hypothetical protein
MYTHVCRKKTKKKKEVREHNKIENDIPLMLAA